MNDSMSASTTAAVEPQANPDRPSLIERLFALYLRGIRAGCLTVVMPSGARMQFVGVYPGPHVILNIHDPRLFIRLLASGDLGFAEGYILGEWDSPDLKSLLTLGALNARAMAATTRPSLISNLLNRFRHTCRANTRRGSRKNIAAHYDLGNVFFSFLLDETMTYSSALFSYVDEPHEEAQRRKYVRLARALDLRPGERVLEIGCGWGGFAEIAAKEFGCTVVGITLSREQEVFARARMARSGLADRVEIRLQDYRDITGTFDKIVSIEMFEAVGEKNWQGYFSVLAQRLNPGGKAGLQVITIDDGAFDAYRRNPDFIQRYIFPGGMLPSPAAFEQAAQDAGLIISDALYFGNSYAESLRRWDRAFQENWPHISRLGFDERFYRMWRYYFTYCEIGFELGRVDVGQFVIERA